MTSWDIQNTDFGRLTVNSTRVLTERVKIDPNPNKKVITLQIGEIVLMLSCVQHNIYDYFQEIHQYLETFHLLKSASMQLEKQLKLITMPTIL